MLCEKNYQDIKNIISDEQRVFCKDAINEDSSRDELSSTRHFPGIAVKVTSIEEVSQILKHADENEIPVTARGSGTGLVGACVPMRGGIHRTDARHQVRI